jgi:hypothetical protein
MRKKKPKRIYGYPWKKEEARTNFQIPLEEGRSQNELTNTLEKRKEPKQTYECSPLKKKVRALRVTKIIRVSEKRGHHEEATLVKRIQRNVVTWE